MGITGFFDSGPVMDTIQIELVKLRPQLAAFLFKAETIANRAPSFLEAGET